MTGIPLLDLRSQGEILPRSFYLRDTVKVSRDLLGKVIVHGRTAGRIVEVEAYLGGEDLAAHSARGITDRTRIIFGPPGHAYVYLIYGMYDCLNMVTEPDGTAGCVLIRAVEPISGIGLMQKRRPAARRLEDLASGPGKLTLALGISRRLNGADLTRGPLTVCHWNGSAAPDIAVSARIGISQCVDWPLRFYESGSRFVSRTRPGEPRA